jgi:ribonuclease HI
MTPMKIVIYCDGAYSQAHEVGSYGVVLFGAKTIEFAEACPGQSVTRMELLGAIVAIESIKKRSFITVYCDCRTVVDGAHKLIPKWITNGWQTCENKQVANKDLWLRLLACCRKHVIQWEWVKGHSGVKHNERADQLAKGAIEAWVKEQTCQ